MVNIEFMKKILVLTSIYPGQDVPKGFTPVVHYFTKEWVKMGYEVRVVHCCTYFPKVFYLAPRWFRKIVQNRFGIALPEKQLNKELEYELDGVRVYRIPLRKVKPMGSYSEKVLMKACGLVDNYIEKESFKPDYIISHWINPQMVLMSHLKALTGAVTTMVLHSTGLKKPFKDWRRLMTDVDIWGYRSLQLKHSFECIYGQPKFSFRCFSGIPEYYTKGVATRDGSFHDRFVQVGILMERKYPDKTIEALATVYGQEEYFLNIVGEGAMKASLQARVSELGANGKVSFSGRLPRQAIIPLLDQSDVFVLISRGEVFGLVYIEAMSRGCIVVASKGEGMEGVIRHGENGFLCEAGNAQELATIISHIRKLSNEERKRISEAAIATSQMLTDVAVARDYIETVIKFSNAIANDNHREDCVYHDKLLMDDVL